MNKLASKPSLKPIRLISFKTWKKGIKKIKNRTIDIKTTVDSADIIENAKMKKNRAINKKNSIIIKLNSDMFLIILKNRLFKILTNIKYILIRWE